MGRTTLRFLSSLQQFMERWSLFLDLIHLFSTLKTYLLWHIYHITCILAIFVLGVYLGSNMGGAW